MRSRGCLKQIECVESFLRTLIFIEGCLRVRQNILVLFRHSSGTSVAIRKRTLQ